MPQIKAYSWKNEADLKKLADLAIRAAISTNWEEAVKINKKIIKQSQNDVEALNRLARAQVCAGKNSLAEKTYKKVIVLDPYNLIAKKNLEKISKLASIKSSNNSHVSNGAPHELSTSFLNEPGKTKVINLLNLAPPAVLAVLNCGEKLLMNTRKHSIGITSREETYLGALPNDLSHRLQMYIAGGNKYDVFVKYATTKSLTVFIKETERSPKFTNQPSFQQSTRI